MTATGYETARQTGEVIARALSDIALLIGEPGRQPVRLHSGEVVAPGLGLTGDAAALSARARDIAQGLFTIIVLGEFKNGKSTLLNGMLGSKTLPAKAAPATAIITMLVHGDRPEVAVHESGAAHPRLVSWEEFVREFQLGHEDQETLEQTGTIDRFAHIEYAEVECQHALCALGVKLIDSPGLGEHLSRTRVATDFLKRSQAVIMVLNATRILSQDERTFIDTVLGPGRLHHVFFVINRINQIEPESVDEIMAWVEARLAPHFTGPDGALDRTLYARRVFFVNARGALEARSTVPPDEALLAASGVPALERELERFLTSGDKVAAVVQSTVQFISPVLDQARWLIESTRSVLDEPLDELERRRAEAERRLRGLAHRKEEIERTILLFGDMVREKVYADLRSFVEEMRDTWDEDSRRLMDLDRVLSIKNVALAYAQREARERMTAAIGEEVQRYLQAKFDEWAERIPSAIGRDVEVMVAEVEAQVDDFQLELDEIAAVFAGGSHGTARGGPAGARLLQLALTLGDIGGLTDQVMGIGDWTVLVTRMVQQAILVFLVATFLTGGNALIALFIVEAIRLGTSEGEIKKRLRRSLGERLHAALREQVQEKRAFIHGAIEERFRRFARDMTGVIGSEIDQVRAEQERILTQKRDERFSVEVEKQRLDTIAIELDRLFSGLHTALNGEP